jgi:H+/gluconate symporter-like permease
MSQTPEPKRDRKQYWLNLTLAGIAGQVGCLTLVIVLGAVFGGLLLDARYQTRPVFTMIFLLASIPVSLAVMFFVVRLATSKIKAGPPKEISSETAQEDTQHEEVGIGKHS